MEDFVDDLIITGTVETNLQIRFTAFTITLIEIFHYVFIDLTCLVFQRLAFPGNLLLRWSWARLRHRRESCFAFLLWGWIGAWRCALSVIRIHQHRWRLSRLLRQACVLVRRQGRAAKHNPQSHLARLKGFGVKLKRMTPMSPFSPMLIHDQAVWGRNQDDWEILLQLHYYLSMRKLTLSNPDLVQITNPFCSVDNVMTPPGTWSILKS